MKLIKQHALLIMAGLLAVPCGQMYANEPLSKTTRLINSLRQVRTGLAHKFPWLTQKVTRGVQKAKAHSTLGALGLAALVTALYLRELQKDRQMAVLKLLNANLLEESQQARADLADLQSEAFILQGSLEQLEQSHQNTSASLDGTACDLEKERQINDALTAFVKNIINRAEEAKKNHRNAGGEYPPVVIDEAPPTPPKRKWGRRVARGKVTQQTYQSGNSESSTRKPTEEIVQVGEAGATLLNWLKGSMRRMPSQLAGLLPNWDQPDAQAPQPALDLSENSNHGKL